MDHCQLDVQDVSVVYPNGHRAIHDVHFQLRGGTVCALVGVNGSGKSTLFNAIMGIVRPQKGVVRLNQMRVQEALRQNLMAYVPQNERIDWHFPILVRDVVMQGRYGHQDWRRRVRPIDAERVEEALQRLGVLDLAQRQIGELSGGQRKRVFLARALAQESPVILLDEPFTGVDVQTEYAIMALLKELREAGYLLLVSTHNLGAVPLYCNEAILLNRTVIVHGNTDDVYNVHNLERAFGSQLKHIGLGDIKIISDDEHPAVFIEGKQKTP